MKFNSVNIPTELTSSKGIDEINIQRLANVVAFVGRNGSGKSRILNLLEQHLFDQITSAKIVDGSITQLSPNIEELKKQLNPFKEYLILLEKIQKLNSRIRVNRDEKTVQEQKIVQAQFNGVNQRMGLNPNTRRQFDQLNSNLSQNLLLLKPKYFRRITNSDIGELQQAINKAPNTDVKFDDLIVNSTNEIDYNEIQSLKSALSFLGNLPHQIAGEQIESIVDQRQFEEQPAYKKFISFASFIKNFLGKDLTWERLTHKGTTGPGGHNVNYVGQFKINDRPFNYTELSEGEKTLFAYALLFFLLDQNPNLNIKESIILIDEPELHLHPESEIALINGLRKVIGEKGQLFIATHSLSILSTLNYEEIFFVDNGKIDHPSHNTPKNSLSALMGIEDHVHNLSDFLGSISTWTYVNFMSECFSNPDVIEPSRQDDPQILAFKIALKNMSTNSNMLLDFGAGKGRLYEHIKDDYNFLNRIGYYSLEKDIEFHQRLKELGSKQVFTSHEELPENTFDFVLLCNVLHEIQLDEWQKTLNRIIKSLKPNGYLIIMEAKVLNKGEKIGKIGYLLLGEGELQILFQLEKLPSSIGADKVSDNITCVVLNRTDLKEISRENIIATLQALEKNTFEKIEKIRDQEVELDESYKVGRKSAFLSQQHINSKLALKHINGN